MNVMNSMEDDHTDAERTPDIDKDAAILAEVKRAGRRPGGRNAVMYMILWDRPDLLEYLYGPVGNE